VLHRHTYLGSVLDISGYGRLSVTCAHLLRVSIRYLRLYGKQSVTCAHLLGSVLDISGKGRLSECYMCTLT